MDVGLEISRGEFRSLHETKKWLNINEDHSVRDLVVKR